MTELVDRHRRACDGFSRVVGMVGDSQWNLPTPCTEWDTRALVEHVIGFHEVLVLRPLGVRAHRPKTGSAARWQATRDALFGALDDPGSDPGQLLAALTTDVLVHTWDLAKSAGVEPELDADLCAIAYETSRAANLARRPDMYAPEVPIADGADAATKLIAVCGRDPAWAPPAA